VHLTKPELEIIIAGKKSKKKTGVQFKGKVKIENLSFDAGLSYRKLDKDKGWNAVIYAVVTNPLFGVSNLVPSAKTH